jgi:hypothetical protein
MAPGRKAASHQQQEVALGGKLNNIPDRSSHVTYSPDYRCDFVLLYVILHVF